VAFPSETLPHAFKEQVIDILAREWPSVLSREEQLQQPLHDPESHPVALVLEENGQVLSYLVIPSRVIHHAGNSYKASGLSAVITHPAYRHRGYGRHIVMAAREVIAATDADIGVFTCDPPLVSFYACCGWTLMEHTVVIGGTRAKPFPADVLGKRTLMGFFSEQARTRRADFEDAAIYLDLRDGDLW
jgi:predicted acetyltransferase